MEDTKTEELKITKNNITKVIIDTFVSKIDNEKKYSLNEFKKLITESFKEIKELKKKKVVKKNPTKYNIFIKEEIQKLRVEFPDLSNKELLKKGAERWREKKETV
tara:strand:+ start:99 stop:413 length:315 start_codon:yes stop_codon:yes gene_type:complete